MAAIYNFPSLSLKATAVNKQSSLTYLLMKDLKGIASKIITEKSNLITALF